MGKVRVIEGVIQEVGYGAVTNGTDNVLSFIKINGERFVDIQCDNQIASYIKPGSTVKLSIAKGWFAHEIAAIQLPDGEVLKDRNGGLVQTKLVGYISFLILFTTLSLWFGKRIFSLSAMAIFVVVMTYLTMRCLTNYRSKARAALDGSTPTKVPTAS